MYTNAGFSSVVVSLKVSASKTAESLFIDSYELKRDFDKGFGDLTRFVNSLTIELLELMVFL